jgi:pimeloyl-ACP methyl ester carboxylesterase
MPSQTVRVGDIDMHYDLADYTPPWKSTPAETVLLYHGYARNMQFWRHFVPLLADRYRVLRFDARGCGETTQPPQGSVFTLAQFVEDAMGLLNALGIDRVHWVGESSGGILGMTAALMRPSRLLTLTMCDTPFQRPADIASAYYAGERDREAAFDKYGVGGWCRKTLSHRIDTTKASAELCEWYIAQMDKNPKHIAVALERMIGAADLWSRLPDIKTPTLILAGEKSSVAKPSMMKDMQQRMPAAKLVSIRGTGHGVNMLEPEMCSQEIRAFLETRGGVPTR